MGRRKSKSKRGKQFPRAVGSSSDPPLPPSTAPPPPPTEPPSTRPPETPSTPPPWIELPRDVTANILQRLGAIEILESAQKVCTTWRRVCQDPSMWRVIDMNYSDIYEYITHMCRLAVDRSQGQLIDLTLDNIGDDELLNYITERAHSGSLYALHHSCTMTMSSCRSTQLKRLTLEWCDQITGGGLVEAAKRLPNLEELHLVLMSSAHPTDIEAIGVSCSMLKSFSFNARRCRHLVPTFPLDDQFVNGYALAIASTMPNLRHLHLFGNEMNNKGLQAILDGCPHLESLDIRQCFDLDLSGDLGNRCSEQIKYLRRPSDSCSDIPWLILGELSDSVCSDLYSYNSYDDFGYYDDPDYGYHTTTSSSENIDDD